MSENVAPTEETISKYLARFTEEQEFDVDDECACCERTDSYSVSKKELAMMLKEAEDAETFEKYGDDKTFSFYDDQFRYTVTPINPETTKVEKYLAKYKDNQLFKVKMTGNCFGGEWIFNWDKYSIRKFAEYALNVITSDDNRCITISVDNHELFIEPLD
jgi:hypothetical protein